MEDTAQFKDYVKKEEEKITNPCAVANLFWFVVGFFVSYLIFT